MKRHVVKKIVIGLFLCTLGGVQTQALASRDDASGSTRKTWKTRQVEGEYEDSREWDDNDKTIFTGLVAIAIVVGGGAYIYSCIAAWMQRRRRNRETFRALGWYRDIPLKNEVWTGGNLQWANDVLVSYGLRRKNDHRRLVLACILQLINIGAIRIEPRKDGGMSYVVSDQLPDHGHQPLFLRKLYSFFLLAAGADRVLDPGEKTAFERDKANGDFLKSYRDTLKVSKFNTSIEQARQVFGLKKFLEEFTLIKERHLTETVLWKDYMVYAMLFGIADQVWGDMRQVNPEFFGKNVVAAQMADKAVTDPLYHSALGALR